MDACTGAFGGKNKNKFSAIWNFEKFDDESSIFYGFKCKDVSFEFCAGYISRISFSVKASLETIKLQKTDFIKNNKLTLQPDSAEGIVSGSFEATKKWTQPIHNWGQAYGEMCIMHEGRLPD